MTPTPPAGPRPRPRARALRQITPAILTLLRASQEQRGDTVTITISRATADAIARIDARRTMTIGDLDRHPAHTAVRRPAQVPRSIAEQWRREAWQAVRARELDIADAQALTDQLQRPDAA